MWYAELIEGLLITTTVDHAAEDDAILHSMYSSWRETR
jgi:hypothetical protein